MSAVVASNWMGEDFTAGGKGPVRGESRWRKGNKGHKHTTAGSLSSLCGPRATRLFVGNSVSLSVFGWIVQSAGLNPAAELPARLPRWQAELMVGPRRRFAIRSYPTIRSKNSAWGVFSNARGTRVSR